MKIKRYLDTDMRKVLRRVREDQGPDAVILSNRRTDDGIEVIAAIDYDESILLQTLGSQPGPSAYRAIAEPAIDPDDRLDADEPEDVRVAADDEMDADVDVDAVDEIPVAGEPVSIPDPVDSPQPAFNPFPEKKPVSCASVRSAASATRTITERTK